MRRRPAASRHRPPAKPGIFDRAADQRGAVARAEGEVTDTDARLWHPWLRINRVLRVMLQTHWSAEAWLVVRVEFRRGVALRSEIRRAGWFN